jgi:hypothetical protein
MTGNDNAKLILPDSAPGPNAASAHRRSLPDYRTPEQIGLGPYGPARPDGGEG